MNTLQIMLLVLSFFAGSQAIASVNSEQRTVIAPGYSAKIQRTSYNIAHITANDMASAWFGQGYAMAEDRICTLMDQVIKVRGQRARFFGSSYIDSDFGYLHLGLLSKAATAFQTLSPEMREMLTAHAAGINAYVSTVGKNGLPTLCRNAAWIVEITAIDLLAHAKDFAILNSSGLLLPFLNNATPPSINAAISSQGATAGLLAVEDSLGSNGWGLGSEATQSGSGMLLAQPHFPWEGELMSWESHITVPGKIDVYGVTLPGIPNVLVGFNASVAWTLTVTPSAHHSFYKLKLVPGEPTKYLYDGNVRNMTATLYTIDMLDIATGVMSQQSRTLWSSHYGPMLSISPLLKWGTSVAMTYRDANLNNNSYLQQLLDMSRANGIEEFVRAHQRWASLPFSHTIATSIEGEAWYADGSPVPHVSDETYAAWQQAVLFDPAVLIPWNFKVYSFDGSTSRDEWVETAGTQQLPGTIPFTEAPQLRRRDFVFNANDNHWLSNPDSLLEGFNPLYGAERTARSLRTRMNAIALTEGSTGRKFSLADVKQAAVSNRSLTAELLRSELVERCTAAPAIQIGSQSVDLSAACAVLSAWDETFNLDSKGAVLFREFLGSFGNVGQVGASTLFAEPFDANNPVTTPRRLSSASSSILTALAKAVQKLDAVGDGVAVDSVLRDLQYTPKNGVKIPIHGGQSGEGIMNIASFLSRNKTTLLPSIPRTASVESTTGLTDDGYAVNFGTSFLMAVELTNEGPECQAVLTFSQSENPESAYFSDQTELFSNKQWRPCLYSQNEILADPALRTYQVHALTADLDNDGDVDRADLRLLLSARNQPATGSSDKRDLNGDGRITVRDARLLIGLCTNLRCS